jgi:hypothetical protein
MTEQDKNQYNLATTNFYLNMVHRLENDIKIAKEKMIEQEHKARTDRQIREIRYWEGVKDQCTTTLSDIKLYHGQAIIH